MGEYPYQKLSPKYITNRVDCIAPGDFGMAFQPKRDGGQGFPT